MVSQQLRIVEVKFFLIPFIHNFKSLHFRMQRLTLSDRYQFSAQNCREQAPLHASEPERAETPDMSTSTAQGLGRLDWLARPGRDWWAAALPGPFSPSSLCHVAPQSRSRPHSAAQGGRGKHLRFGLGAALQLTALGGDISRSGSGATARP